MIGPSGALRQRLADSRAALRQKLAGSRARSVENIQREMGRERARAEVRAMAEAAMATPPGRLMAAAGGFGSRVAETMQPGRLVGAASGIGSRVLESITSRFPQAPGTAQIFPQGATVRPARPAAPPALATEAISSPAFPAEQLYVREVPNTPLPVVIGESPVASTTGIPNTIARPRGAARLRPPAPSFDPVGPLPVTIENFPRTAAPVNMEGPMPQPVAPMPVVVDELPSGRMPTTTEAPSQSRQSIPRESEAVEPAVSPTGDPPPNVIPADPYTESAPVSATWAERMKRKIQELADAGNLKGAEALSAATGDLQLIGRLMPTASVALGVGVPTILAYQAGDETAGSGGALLSGATAGAGALSGRLVAGRYTPGHGWLGGGVGMLAGGATGMALGGGVAAAARGIVDDGGGLMTGPAAALRTFGVEGEAAARAREVNKMANDPMVRLVEQERERRAAAERLRVSEQVLMQVYGG